MAGQVRLGLVWFLGLASFIELSPCRRVKKNSRVNLGGVRLGQVRLGFQGLVKLGQVRLGFQGVTKQACNKNKTGRVKGQVRLGQVRLGQVRLGQVRLGFQGWLGQVRLCYVRLGFQGLVRLGQVQGRLGQVRLGSQGVTKQAGIKKNRPCER